MLKCPYPLRVILTLYPISFRHNMRPSKFFCYLNGIPPFSCKFVRVSVVFDMLGLFLIFIYLFIFSRYNLIVMSYLCHLNLFI